MRIGLACDDSLDVLDGVQRYMVTLGEELRRRGHEVCYLVGQSAAAPVPGVVSLGRIVSFRFGGNLLRTSLPISGRTARSALAALRLDVLHVQAPYGPLLVGRLIRAAGRSTHVVATWHTLRGSAAVGLWSRLVAASIRGSLPRIEQSVAVSPATQAFALDYYRVGSRVVGCPIDLEHYRGVEPAPKPAGTRRIVFLGRLVPHKGPDVLIEALGRAERRGELPPGTELVVIGDGSMRADLERRAARLRAPVRFLGAVYGPAKVAWLASADVAAFPALAESFGIVLLEAIAAGAGVVLASDNPGYRYVLNGDEDALFDRTNPDELAALLARALTDEPFRAAVHERQAERVAAFDVGVVADRMEALYRSRTAGSGVLPQ